MRTLRAARQPKGQHQVCIYAFEEHRLAFPLLVRASDKGAFHIPRQRRRLAADFGLRLSGLPALSLWHVLLPHQPPLFFHEDNQAMIHVVTTGRNPTMRYLHRTHRVSVSWLHEVYKRDDVVLMYEDSAKMAADIYTKGFTDG